MAGSLFIEGGWRGETGDALIEINGFDQFGKGEV
jgi:hypothetical protein